MSLIVDTKPWPEIVTFYRELIDHWGWKIGPMLALVESIASSPYAMALFPRTSHARLCIARTRTILWQHAMLTVQYDPVGEGFVFEYFEASLNARPWATRCPANEGQSRFEWLMKKRLRWFKDAWPGRDN